VQTHAVVSGRSPQLSNGTPFVRQQVLLQQKAAFFQPVSVVQDFLQLLEGEARSVGIVQVDDQLVRE